MKVLYNSGIIMMLSINHLSLPRKKTLSFLCMCVFGPHPRLLKAYSWLCIRESLLVGWGTIPGCWGLNAGKHKASTLPFVLLFVLALRPCCKSLSSLKIINYAKCISIFPLANIPEISNVCSIFFCHEYHR